jgi:hypothetical protein
MKESTTYQAILQEGMEEGIKQGALFETKKLLQLAGEQQFGAPDARSKAALERIQDGRLLEAMILRLPDAAGWADLLDHASPRRRKGRRPPSAGGQ